MNPCTKPPSACSSRQHNTNQWMATIINHKQEVIIPTARNPENKGIKSPTPVPSSPILSHLVHPSISNVVLFLLLFFFW